LPAQELLERRALEHKDYDVWQTVGGQGLSRDGNWVWYQIQNGAIDGEPKLTIRNLNSGKEYNIDRGARPRISFDSRFAMYRITPDKKKVKELRKKKTKSEDMPKAVFQILELKTGELTTVENVSSFKTPEENADWVAILLDDPNAGKKVVSKKSSVAETYEVTPEGLRRPAAKQKLKKRSELIEKEVGEEEEEAKETEKKSKEESKSKVAKESKKEDKEKDKKEKKAGQPLLLINLDTGVRRTFPLVAEYTFSKYADALAFVTSVPEAKEKQTGKGADKKNAKAKSDKEDDEDDDAETTDGVHIIQLKDLKTMQLIEGTGNYKNLAFDEKGTQLAFITDRDDYKTKTSTWTLYHWKAKAKSAKKIAVEGDKGVPKDWWIATRSSQLFSKDGKRLYFETAPVPDKVIKERELTAAGKEADEDDGKDQAKLDIWHWQDPQLQPQQLLQAAIERNRDYRAVYNIESKKIHQLATRQIPVVPIDVESDSKVAMANTNVAYRKMLSWDIPGFQDAWIVNLENGKRERVLEKVKWSASLSPNGKYVVWFDSEEKQWFAKPSSDPESEPAQISKGIKHPLQNELHDTPNLPRAYGSAGWTSEDTLLVYDRFDIWELDPTGGEEPVCVTQSNGREKSISFRYQRLDRDERVIDREKPMVLSAFNRETKASGYFQLTPGDKESEATLKQLIMLDESVGQLRKAEDSDAVVFTRSTFRMSPDLWSSDLDFKKISRVSDINPQQDQYTWGSAELVSWEATDGQELEGLLYKPDGFDPKKKYPLMVYFYERNSDNLHRYYAPAAGRSIINFSFYVSRGYVVFVPDIPYRTGEPGPSAANAILPGVESLVGQGFIDEKKIGMQGHSWGGYQTAYLVTQTDMFACAESGAPVSNMTSAYGGIRWASGMSRMFQYERTQSRIGDTLWSAREKYIANSPVFFADKVNTPLLILHNDEDGAVPWYQGIEMFVALRRLEKPAWMLNYNGDPHWVMGDYNRRDFATRMQQFFDHYLKDAPEPEWMAVGVPAVKKGKEFGLSLLAPAEEETTEEEATEESAEESSEEE
jgi:dipeptidyl aminopeptidase/acylaminoacyl peptidase